MQELFGGGIELGWVALKAMLLYLTALFAFRIGRRRTIAEMSPFDFVAAVAVGAIVGRVPNASDTSYLAGVITLVTLLLLHAVICRLRFHPKVAPIIDHPPIVLVSRGRMLERELRCSGLTPKDVEGILRQHQITDVAQVEFLILEQRGHVSIFRTETPGVREGKLVRDVVEQADRSK